MQNVGKRNDHINNHSLQTTEGEHYAKKMVGQENHQRDCINSHYRIKYALAAKETGLKLKFCHNVSQPSCCL